jgi:hypothetical protein
VPLNILLQDAKGSDSSGFVSNCERNKFTFFHSACRVPVPSSSNRGLSFVGIVCPQNRFSRVVITQGNTALGMIGTVLSTNNGVSVKVKELLKHLEATVTW